MPLPPWLFDVQPHPTYQGVSPDTLGDPLTPTGYQSRKPGLLSKISNVGTGILDPFLQAYGGGGAYAALLKRQADEDQANMEFQRFLISNQSKYDLSNSGMPVFTVDPLTGNFQQVGMAPKGSRVVSAPNVTTEKVQMGSALDNMLSSINSMEEKLSDPNILIRNVNPFGEREFKAILSNFDKEASIAAGGKQLTQTELNLIRETRPGLLDAKSPKAISYKLNKLRATLGDAKARLEGARTTSQVGSKVGSSDSNFQSFEIDGIPYKIPKDKVEAFKKAKGIK